MTGTILTSAAAGGAIGAKLGSAVGIAAFGTATAGTLPFAVLGAAAAGGAAYIGGALISTAGAGAAAGGAGIAKFAAGAAAAQAAGALYRAAKRHDARTGGAAAEAVLRSLDAEQDRLDAAAARRPLFVEPLDLHAVSADDLAAKTLAQLRAERRDPPGRDRERRVRPGDWSDHVQHRGHPRVPKVAEEIRRGRRRSVGNPRNVRRAAGPPKQQKFSTDPRDRSQTG